MANIYTEEGNIEHAFLLYNKYITLFIEKLPKHRDYKTANIPEKKDTLKKLKDVAFPQAEVLKKALLRRFEQEHAQYLVKKMNKRDHRLRLRLAHVRCVLPPKAEDEALAQEQSRQRALDAERERVAEMQRRQREQEQFSAFEEMIRRQELEKERQRVLLEFATPAMPSPDMPLIPASRGPRWSPPTLHTARGTSPVAPTTNTITLPLPSAHLPPARQLRPLAQARVSGQPGEQQTSQESNFSAQLLSILFMVCADTMVDALRQLAVPAELCRSFLRLAEANTSRAVETCGILCGKL
ncbi:hypothetical protein INR49_018208, partial [Caranx melampygus]